MASKWTNAKKERAKQVGGMICEICSRPSQLGHHIVPREKGGADSVTNVQLRCSKCERICHELFKDGNPTDEWIQKRKAFFGR